MPELARRSKKYMASPIRRIASMIEKAGFDPEIISFGGGAPSLSPPTEILTAMSTQMKKCPQSATAYCSTIGLPKTREAISQDLKQWEKVDIGPDQISLAVGGTEALYVTLQTILNPGDHILTSDPSYLGYREPIKLTGAKEIMIPTTPKTFQIKQEEYKKAINKKTKAIMLASPDNPTGMLFDDKSMKFLVDLAEDHDLWLITDDIYKHIIYKGKFKNSRLYGAEDRTITCCSFSKTASIPGLRIGYYYGPKEVVKKISEIKQSTSLAPPKTVQYAIQKLLENKANVRKQYLKNTVIPTYKSRMKKMNQCLKKYMPEAQYETPNGAFYYFPSIGMDDVKFADQLLEQEKVVVIPGTYFGIGQGTNHVRLTFVSEPEERIEEGFRRIRHFMETC